MKIVNIYFLHFHLEFVSSHNLTFGFALLILYYFFSASQLPQPLTDGTLVPFGNGVLLVGGRTWYHGDPPDCHNHNTIYYYNLDENSWTLRIANMKRRKHNVIAMVVDRNLFVTFERWNNVCRVDHTQDQ